MIDIEENKDTLINLKQNLSIYKESIREIAEEIIRNKVSNYPIFIASMDEIMLGKLVIDKEDLALEWNISASTLEEFLSRKIISEDKLAFFKNNYKNPDQYICLFAIMNGQAGFIFLPYES